jgi:hypothetical protein
MQQPTEPSVLDYVKSKFKFWGKEQIEIPSAVSEVQVSEELAEQPQEQPRVRKPVPWRSLLALVLAVFAQQSFEPVPAETRAWIPGTVLYLATLGLLIWAYRKGDWTLPSLPINAFVKDPLTFRWKAFVASLVLGAISFYLMKGNLFTALNLTFWILAIAAHLWAFWLRDPQAESLWSRVKRFLTRPFWDIRFTRWTLLIFAVAALILSSACID